MKKLMLVIILFISIGLIADYPGQAHWVSFEVKDSGGNTPTSNIEFDATLNSNSVDETTNISNFMYTYNGGTGVGAISLQVQAIDGSWDFGDELTLSVTYTTPDPDETGTASFILGSFASDSEEIPIGSGGICLVPYEEQEVANGVDETFLAGDAVNSCVINPACSGTTPTLAVGVPASDFASLPGWSSSRGDDPDIYKCFSIDEVSGTFTSVDVEFTWTGDAIGNSNRVLLVSPDGINWIYSDNANYDSGISSLRWVPDTGDTFSEGNGLAFTTSKFAHFAIGNGSNIPEVTTPNAPAGGTATLDGTNLTITCRKVAVPGATYKIYTSTSFNGTWTDTGITVGDNGDLKTGTVTGVSDPADVKYYAMRAYNGNTTYLSELGETLFAMVKNVFETGSSKYMNLVRFPFSTLDSNCDSASELGNLLTTTYCNAVVGWDKTNQKYDYCVYMNGIWQGDFTLSTDGIYFVSVGSGVSDLTQSKKLNKTVFNLKEGVNPIYVSPLDSSLTNASDLMEDIGTGIECTKVVQWNASSQTWSTYTGTETDFSLSEIQPVFVTVTENVVYSK